MATDNFRAGNTQTYIGLSTDSKPTLQARTGDFFFETDTGNLYIWNGAAQAWTLYCDQAGSDFTALTLAAQAAGTVTSSDLQIGADQGSVIGFNVSINITSVTGSLTVTIQGKDGASGTYYTLLASAALASVAFTRLQVGATIAASANLIAQSYVPRTIRISAVVATGPVSATIGVSPL